MTEKRPPEFVRTSAIRDAIKGREGEILSSLGVKWTGQSKHIRCPYRDHLDNNPSWRWDAAKGRAYCTCTRSDSIFDVISKVKGIDFEAAKIVAAEIIVRTDLIRRSHRNSDGRKGERSSGKNGATPQQSTNCTMAAYAKAKQLTPEFLRSVGVVEISYCSHPALKIPYRDMSGAEAAVRFRVSLEGKDKFRWRKGSKPLLYGLDRINEARTANAVTIVEGESDCHTLWQAGFPAFGLPGANNWNEGRDAAIFEGIGNIFVVIESDAGGEQVINWLAKSKIRDRVKLVRLQGFKDPSALYLNDPASFAQRWQTALDNSVTWRDEAECKRQAARDAAWRVCQGVAQCPNILDQPVGESAQVDSTASERGAPHYAMKTRKSPGAVAAHGGSEIDL